MENFELSQPFPIVPRKVNGSSMWPKVGPLKPVPDGLGQARAVSRPSMGPLRVDPVGPQGPDKVPCNGCGPDELSNPGIELDEYINLRKHEDSGLQYDELDTFRALNQPRYSLWSPGQTLVAPSAPNLTVGQNFFLQGGFDPFDPRKGGARPGTHSGDKTHRGEGPTRTGTITTGLRDNKYVIFVYVPTNPGESCCWVQFYWAEMRFYQGSTEVPRPPRRYKGLIPIDRNNTIKATTQSDLRPHFVLDAYPRATNPNWPCYDYGRRACHDYPSIHKMLIALFAKRADYKEDYEDTFGHGKSFYEKKNNGVSNADKVVLTFHFDTYLMCKSGAGNRRAVWQFSWKAESSLKLKQPYAARGGNPTYSSYTIVHDEPPQRGRPTADQKRIAGVR